MFKYLFGLVIFAAGAFAQPLRPGEWRSYTAMTSVTSVAVTPDSTAVWVTTMGGAFRVNLADPKSESFALRTLDGISSNELTSVTVDTQGDVYFGGNGGTIDIYTPSTGDIHSIHDIVLSTLITKKTINRINVVGERVYIAANYGMSIYDRVRKAFGETVTRFSTLPAQDTVFSTLEVGGKIYVATPTAIAVADRNSPQLSAPFAWKLFPAPDDVSLRTLSVFGGKVVAAGFGGAFTIDADSLARLPLADTVLIFEAASRDGKLYFLDKISGGRFITTTDLAAFDFTAIEEATAESVITCFGITGTDAFAFGRAASGVTLKSASGTTSDVFPPGPISNDIIDIYYARSIGKLFVSHSFSGISSFDVTSSGWKHYTTGGSSPSLQRAKYENIYYDSIRSVLWASTFGDGLMKCTFNGDALTYKNIDGDDGIPPADASNPHFVVLGQSMLDSKGDLIISAFAENGNGIARTSDGNTFTSMRLAPSGQVYRPWKVLAEDLEGFYYAGTPARTIPPPFGVCYITPEGIPGALAGGSGGILATANVNALAIDQDNNLWCGTTEGVEIVSHFRSSRTGALEFRARKLPFLDQQVVYALATDGVGNKWVGTENGVFVVSPDGSDSLAHYTTSNSPLLANTVVAISVDAGTGEVYIGTSKGISRTSSLYKEGSPDYSTLHVYPNPIVRSRDEQPLVTIAGLVSGSTVKIYTVSGRLVKSIDASSLGSAVTWDGRDENGNELSSGIYVVGATSQLAAESGQAKFVLIRK